MGQDGTVERHVRAYFAGWLAADRDAILATLHPDCVVIESYGPVYRGIDQVARWIDGWLAPGNRVTRWDITALDATADACFVEWDFGCLYGGSWPASRARPSPAGTANGSAISASTP